MKSTGVAFLFWLLGLVGLCGLHRFYVGRVGTGLLWLFTLGFLGIGQLIDLFSLGSMVRYANLMRLGQAVATASATATTHFSPTININVPGMAPQIVQPALAQAVGAPDSISSAPSSRQLPRASPRSTCYRRAHGGGVIAPVPTSHPRPCSGGPWVSQGWQAAAAGTPAGAACRRAWWPPIFHKQLTVALPIVPLDVLR
jgi:TM2 domain-containing membrane protein YozV